MKFIFAILFFTGAVTTPAAETSKPMKWYFNNEEITKDGEMSIYPDRNQIILSDWTSNINRVADILAMMDKPLDPAVAKLADAARKDQDTNMKEFDKKYSRDRGEKPPPPLEAPTKAGH